MSYTTPIVSAIKDLDFPFGIPGIITGYVLSDYDKINWFVREEIIIHGDGEWACETLHVCDYKWNITISSSLTPGRWTELSDFDLIEMLNQRQVKIGLENDLVVGSEKMVQYESMLKKLVDRWQSL